MTYLQCHVFVCVLELFKYIVISIINTYYFSDTVCCLSSTFWL